MYITCICVTMKAGSQREWYEEVRESYKIISVG